MPATSGNNTSNKSTNLLDGLIPAGTLVPWPSALAVPSGYLEALGQVVLRADYPGVFAAHGTTWNTGGETGLQFRLPNGQGRTHVGAGTYTDTVSGSVTRTTGQTLGAEKHALALAENGPHTHTGTSNATNISHQHSILHNYSGYAGGGGVFGALATFPGAPGVNNPTIVGVQGGYNTNFTDPVHSHTFTSDSSGSGTAHNNMQPSLVGRWLVKI